MRNLIGNALALAIASVSFALTIAVVLGIERAADVNIFSIMWWGFIPAGAFAVGCLAASGYYVGAVKLNVKPTQLVAVSLFLVTALVQVALYYAQYAMARTADGQAISQFIGFPRFVGWSLSHARYGLIVNGYRPGGANGGLEVGFLGYLIAMVQFLGLAAGGWVVYFMLADKPYCESCAKYLKATRTVKHPFAGDLGTLKDLRNVDAPSGAYFEAVRTLPPGDGAALEIELSTCPQCNRESLAERPMFVKEGKLSYEAAAFRTLWNAGPSVAREVGSLRAPLT